MLLLLLWPYQYGMEPDKFSLLLEIFVCVNILLRLYT